MPQIIKKEENARFLNSALRQKKVASSQKKASQFFKDITLHNGRLGAKKIPEALMSLRGGTSNITFERILEDLLEKDDALFFPFCLFLNYHLASHFNRSPKEDTIKYRTTAESVFNVIFKSKSFKSFESNISELHLNFEPRNGQDIKTNFSHFLEVAYKNCLPGVFEKKFLKYAVKLCEGKKSKEFSEGFAKFLSNLEREEKSSLIRQHKEAMDILERFVPEEANQLKSTLFACTLSSLQKKL